MPSLESNFRYQTAVLWEASTETNTHGINKAVSPVEIIVRWDDRRSEGRDAKGNLVSFDVSIVADRVIPVGSYLREGTLDEVTDPPDNLCRVIMQNAVPDVKGRNVRYLNGLMRSKDKLPEVVT